MYIHDIMHQTQNRPCTQTWTYVLCYALPHAGPRMLSCNIPSCHLNWLSISVDRSAAPLQWKATCRTHSSLPGSRMVFDKGRFRHWQPTLSLRWLSATEAAAPHGKGCHMAAMLRAVGWVLVACCSSMQVATAAVVQASALPAVLAEHGPAARGGSSTSTCVFSARLVSSTDVHQTEQACVLHVAIATCFAMHDLQTLMHSCAQFSLNLL